MTTEPTPANATSESITEAPAPQAPVATAIAELPTAPTPPAPTTVAPPAPSPTAEPAWVLKIDYTLLGFLLILSFFVASFAAANSDLWLHLAIGKRISEGKFEFGVDPYSWATEATPERPAAPWIHQAWLFSWLVYQIHESALGGAGLVAIKAMVFTLAIGLLSRIGWNGANRWLILICLALAVLAASGRLTLQPMVISLLFLAITLLVLDRAGAFALRQNDPQETRRSSWGLWCLPPLFALWANLDACFILGPIVVGLCWAATGLGRWFPSAKMLPGKTLGLVFFVGLMTCQLNPYGVRVFQLPPELAYLILSVTDPLRIPVPDALAAGGRTLRELRRIDADFLSTLPIVSDRYWKDTRFGLNIAGLAIVPLVLLGLLAFTLTAMAKPQKEAPAFHVGRFLLWLAFAVMGLALYRLAPFFALLAAPLTAMTLGEFLRWQQANSTQPADRRNRGLKLARCVSVPFFLMLIGLAWPGWLHGGSEYTSPRRVAWAVRPDESLQRAAEALNELNKAGECKNVFNGSFELANYLPWFAPDVKYCMDTRLALYPQEVAEFARARDGLNNGPDADWQPIFRAHNIDQIAMVSANFLARDLGRLLRWWFEPGTWRQRYADKRAVVFSWAGVNRRWPGDQMSVDLDRQAFGVVPLDRRPPFTGAAPPKPQDAWAGYLEGVPPQPAQVGAVELMERRFAIANQFTNREGIGCRLIGVMGSLSSLQSVPGGGMALPPAFAGLAFTTLSTAPGDFGPPALPILMVRAARQAVAENPLDVKAHIVLEQAIETLRRNQDDYWIHLQPQRSQHPSKLRDRLREVQQVVSLLNAVQLQPENFILQEKLVSAYLNEETPMLEAALDHRQMAQKGLETLRASKSAEDAKKIDALIKQYHNDVEGLDRAVKQRLAKWKEMTGKEKPFTKAYVAYHGTFDVLVDNRPVRTRLGLGKTALSILDGMDFETLKDNEKLPYAVLYYDLLLSMGRAAFVAKNLRDERVKKSMPPAIYAQFQLIAAGALGDYKTMDEALTTIETVMRQQAAKAQAATKEHALACVPWFFKAGTEFSSGGLRYTVAQRALKPYQEFNAAYFSYRAAKGELCNDLTLHGIILLEAGETRKARDYFQTALAEGEGAPFFADRPIAQRYRNLLERQK